jgi:hypothetical protein
MTIIYFSSDIATKHGKKSPYELSFGCTRNLDSSLKVFGEIGVVITKHTIQGKLRTYGSTFMFVDYNDNHSRDVLHMLHLKTLEVINYRDVV